MKMFKEIFPSYFEIVPIIQGLKDRECEPFTTLDTDKITMIASNIFNECFEKFASILIENIDSSSPYFIDYITNTIILHNKYKWLKLCNIETLEYNPLDNVNATESFKTTYNHGKVVTLTPDTSVITEQIENTTSANYFNGDNTTDPQLTDKQEINGGKSKTTTSGIDTTTNSGSDIEEVERKRSGNIGVTMSQQLISAEIDLWGKWDLWTFIIADIVNMLTNPMYCYTENEV